MRLYPKKTLILVLAGAITLQSTACGTLLYPERRGQMSGRIDPAVAIMNGIGLLFFILPGVVAFAVDFSTGAIYLPGTGRRSENQGNTGDVRRVALQGPITADSLSKLIAEETGRTVDLSQVQVRDATGTAPELLVSVLNSGHKDRPSYN
jgi:hypothetical protein